MSNTVERKKVTPRKYAYSNCSDCGGKFEQYRAWQKFCCKLCKFRAWAKEHPRVKSKESI